MSLDLCVNIIHENVCGSCDHTNCAWETTLLNQILLIKNSGIGTHNTKPTDSRIKCDIGDKDQLRNSARKKNERIQQQLVQHQLARITLFDNSFSDVQRVN